MTKKAKAVANIVMFFMVGPIWYYLLFKILTFVRATELMWFLYWIYLPVAILAGIINAIVTVERKP